MPDCRRESDSECRWCLGAGDFPRGAVEGWALRSLVVFASSGLNELALVAFRCEASSLLTSAFPADARLVPQNARYATYTEPAKPRAVSNIIRLSPRTSAKMKSSMAGDWRTKKQNWMDAESLYSHRIKLICGCSDFAHPRMHSRRVSGSLGHDRGSLTNERATSANHFAAVGC